MLLAAVLAAGALSACGGGSVTRTSLQVITVGVPSKAPHAAQKLGIPLIATKNTTRVDGADPAADAAGVAQAVYPSAAPGTHPAAVTLAPTDAWQAALASSVLMAPPVGAPVLLSGPKSLPSATADALAALNPRGSGAADGAQVIRVGSVPATRGRHSVALTGSTPYAVAASIDRFVSAIAGRPTADVVIASGTDPAYAMPAAGWAAESGDPILFVSATGIPAPTRQALQAHSHPNIYVLGPPSVISDAILAQLGQYGTVKRVGAQDPAANSVAFAIYRDPACAYGQPCVHVPGSFGWAMRSPGHGYVLLSASRPLDAAAAAALSGSGDYGPALLVENPSTLPPPVLNFFLDYATPGYTQEGPTAAVYNHGWVIGDTRAVSISVQAEMDKLLQAIPQANGK
jgi:Cell wall binding domain 2 (CWB2)